MVTPVRVAACAAEVAVVSPSIPGRRTRLHHGLAFKFDLDLHDCCPLGEASGRTAANLAGDVGFAVRRGWPSAGLGAALSVPFQRFKGGPPLLCKALSVLVPGSFPFSSFVPFPGREMIR